MKRWELETERYKYVEALRNGQWWLVNVSIPEAMSQKNICCSCGAVTFSWKKQEDAEYSAEWDKGVVKGEKVVCKCGKKMFTERASHQEVLDLHDKFRMRIVCFQRAGYAVMKVDSAATYEYALNNGVKFVEKFEKLEFETQRRKQEEGFFIRQANLRVVDCDMCGETIVVVGRRERCHKCIKIADAEYQDWLKKKQEEREWCKKNLTMELCVDGLPECWCGVCAKRVKKTGKHAYRNGVRSDKPFAAKKEKVSRRHK